MMPFTSKAIIAAAGMPSKVIKSFSLFYRFKTLLMKQKRSNKKLAITGKKI
jgi:hypothetical protein